LEHLKSGLAEVNEMQKRADSMAMDLASGKNDNLHETMLATTQAELTFNLMVQLRNRALEAYQEVMRMPV
jgi:flagellar hook-basal body complex protein FliE